MFRINQLPLTKKLVALSTVTSLVALLIASGAWIVDSWVSGRDSLQQEIQSLSKLIADHSNAALAFGDTQLASRNLGTLNALPNIITACIYDQDGNLFAGFHRSTPPTMECALQSDLAADYVNENAIYLYEPVMLDNSAIGGLFIHSDLSRVYTQLGRAAASTLFIIFLAGLAAYGVSSRLQRFISKPVRELSDVARQVSEQHNYQVRATKYHSDDELDALVDAFNEMLETIDIQNRSLISSRSQLEHLVEKRTSELSASNKELEAFSYSVSHDLRAPLRSINGFGQALLEDYNDTLDDNGKDFLNRVISSADRMGTLIDDLLDLSRVTRCALKPVTIDMSAMAREIADELLSETGQAMEIKIHPGITACGDPVLMRSVLDNLIGNAFKYSSRKDSGWMEFAQSQQDGRTVYRVCDNGAGFNMKYVDKLFSPFQRLHRAEEFEGTGVGLATVARVVRRHGGEVWASSEIDQGACFYFTLDTENILNTDTD